MAASSIASTPLTLMHFILSSQQEHPEATGDFTISEEEFLMSVLTHF